MNEEGGAAARVAAADAEMEFGAGGANALPPIDDPRRQQLEKASQKAARDA